MYVYNELYRRERKDRRLGTAGYGTGLMKIISTEI